jgi:hypothetical protein
VALAGFAVFAVLSAGVALGAGQLFVPTHTHQYVPKGMAVGGGPGELLNLDDGAAVLPRSEVGHVKRSWTRR